MKNIIELVTYIHNVTGKKPETLDELLEETRTYIMEQLKECNECDIPGLFKVQKHGEVIKLNIDGQIVTMNIHGELLN